MQAATKSPYERWRELRETSPVQASIFFQNNERAIGLSTPDSDTRASAKGDE